MTTEAVKDNTYTRGIAAFVSGLRYENIPANVVERVKLLILDGLGCGIYGALPQHSKILVSTLSKVDDTKACGVWGTRQRLSAPHAALANGSQIQGFELDDGHSRGSVHVNSGALPALMAVVELRPNISGREFITAAVAAFETAARVGMCMGQTFAVQGWHSGALSVFPAAMAAASALKLSEEQTVHTLGIAGTQAAGLMAAQYGSMVKRMHAGRGSQAGLYSALLAESGFTGIVNLFESEYGGFCTTFTRSTDRFDLTQLTLNLGKEFETLRVSLKFYACAASNHTSLDAIREIRARHAFAVEDIDKVIVHAAQLVVKHVGWKYQPAGLTSAQMNLPFCAATLLLEGDVFIEQFTEAAVTDAARIALADKVEVREDPAISAKGRSGRYQVRVEILLKDGTRLEQIVEAARGSDRKFASADDVAGKFSKLASNVLPQQQVSDVIQKVLNLEQESNASALAKLLTLH